MSSPSLNFRLPPEMLDWVVSEAKKLDRTPGWIARKGILQLMSNEAVRQMEAKSTIRRQAAKPPGKKNGN